MARPQMNINNGPTDSLNADQPPIHKAWTLADK